MKKERFPFPFAPDSVLADQGQGEYPDGLRWYIVRRPHGKIWRVYTGIPECRKCYKGTLQECFNYVAVDWQIRYHRIREEGLL